MDDAPDKQAPSITLKDKLLYATSRKTKLMAGSGVVVAAVIGGLYATGNLSENAVRAKVQALLGTSTPATTQAAAPAPAVQIAPPAQQTAPAAAVQVAQAQGPQPAATAPVQGPPAAQTVQTPPKLGVGDVLWGKLGVWQPSKANPGTEDFVGTGTNASISGNRIMLSGVTIAFDHVVDRPESSTCSMDAGGTFECGRGALAVLREMVADRDVICRITGVQAAEVKAVCQAGKVVDLGGALVAGGWLSAADEQYGLLQDQAVVERRGLWQWRLPEIKS